MGAEIEFPKVTVGGTHVALMAASTARGSTLISNAAREPEVVDLADCLDKMGARIHGAGTSTIEIHGVAALNGAHHRVLPDRIEAGTYATAVAMTGGDILLEGVGEDLFKRPLEALGESGATVVERQSRRAACGATARESTRSTSRPRPSRASRPTCRRSSWR